MSNTAVEAEAFAELVRKMAIGIVSSLNAGKVEQATDIALSLLGQACDRKKEFANVSEDNNPARYDLKTLFSENDELPESGLSE